MIPRPEPIRQIGTSFHIHPATALLGPRQCGKTTLARFIAEQEPSTFFDLEDPVDIQRLTAPMQALKDLSGLVIIDEIQRKPELFELLRVLVDRSSGQNTKFLLLGSASPHLVKGVSESLAGRIGFVDLGGFPKSFLADSESDSILWRESFIRTFLERDIPQLGINIAAETLRRFWTMVAHYHGQVWNAAEFARALGTAENTARRYLDILSGAGIDAFRLPSSPGKRKKYSSSCSRCLCGAIQLPLGLQ
ncbi:MAG TPA: ATP-binding protein [Deltaproteobacteria bacterium]|nr:ATP-binding protein [Deltaproteobacteria bacterium]